MWQIRDTWRVSSNILHWLKVELSDRAHAHTSREKEKNNEKLWLCARWSMFDDDVVFCSSCIIISYSRRKIHNTHIHFLSFFDFIPILVHFVTVITQDFYVQIFWLLPQLCRVCAYACMCVRAFFLLFFLFFRNNLTQSRIYVCHSICGKSHIGNE